MADQCCQMLPVHSYSGRTSSGILLAVSTLSPPLTSDTCILTILMHVDACLYCSFDLSKSPQVDLYGNPCCSNCFDNAAFFKNPTVSTVPALLSADKDVPSTQKEKNKAEHRRLLITPMAAKMGPAVRELRTRIEGQASHEGLPSAIAGSSNKAQAKLPVIRAPCSPTLAVSPELGDKFTSVINGGLSPRAAVTSPRIAASKAFFDAMGSDKIPSYTTRGLSTYAKGSSFISTPSSHNDTQKSAWQGHKVSQSMPVLPKVVPYESSVQSEAITFNAEPRSFHIPGRNDTKSQTVAKSALEQDTTTTEQSKPSRVARPLPVPTDTTTTVESPHFPSISSHVKTFGQSVSGGACIVPHSVARGDMQSRKIQDSSIDASPEHRPKVSAAILQRSKSFRQAVVEDDINGQMKASRAQESGAPHSQAENQEKAIPPRYKRTDSGLSRCNATSKGKSGSPEICKTLKTALPASDAYFESGMAATAALQVSVSIDPDARCGGCKVRLFRVGGQRDPNSTKIISVSGTGERYHAKCFTCYECDLTLEGGKFVLLENGTKVHEQVSSRIH